MVGVFHRSLPSVTPNRFSCLLLGRRTAPRSEAHGGPAEHPPPDPGGFSFGDPGAGERVQPSPPAGRSGSALPTGESHKNTCFAAAARHAGCSASVPRSVFVVFFLFFFIFLEDFGMKPAAILTSPQRSPHLEAFFFFSPRAALALQTAPATWEAAWSRSQRRIFGGLLFSSSSYTTAEGACGVSTAPRQRRACWFGHACDSVDAPGGVGSKQDPPGDFG